MIREFIDMLPQRARDRVRPTWLPEGEAELGERCKRHKLVRAGYREAQR